MMDVACASDRGYLPHAATMMRSLLAHNKPAGTRLHLLHAPDLHESELLPIVEMVARLGSSLQLHGVPDEAVEGLPSAGRISRVMWYRIFLPQLLPTSRRAVYLDCDTIVVDDLTPLDQVDLGGCAIGAVHNVMEPGSQRAAQLGLPAGQPYFNSGVLVLDLAAWRDGSIGERVLAFARANGDTLLFPDQDALNVVLGSDRSVLNPRWNCQNTLFYWPQANEVFGVDVVRAACADPAVVHFEGPELAKPWHYLSKHPYRSAYLLHRSKTPWPTDVIEGRTLGNRLLRPLPPGAIARVLHAKAKWRSKRA